MDERKIFIVGANGQLGIALRNQYPKAQFADIERMDITNQQSVQAYDWTKVSIILNAAAFTNVDGAETAEGRVAAWNVNAQAVSYLTNVAKENDLTMVHISTDYVFDGTHTNHKEDEPFSPLSIYGASKAAGDIALSIWPKHYLLRTSWVIGEGKNFVKTMLALGQKGVSPTVVADQVGRPTLTSQLVVAIDHLLSDRVAYGTYNVTNDGDPVSWADLTRKIFKIAGFNLDVTNTTTPEYYANKKNVANRPLSSVFDLSKIKSTGLELRNWQDDLQKYINKELSE